jgi:hypothetical protein
LTESSDRSDSTSSEIRSENEISDNEDEENGNILLYAFYIHKFLILSFLMYMNNYVFIINYTNFKCYIGSIK